MIIVTPTIFLMTMMMMAMPSSSSSAGTTTTIMNERIRATSDKIHRKLQDGGGATTTDGGDADASSSTPGIFCQWVEAVLGNDFLEGEATGTCNCDGAIDTAIELSCNLNNICGDGGTNNEDVVLCGNLEYNVTLSGVWVDGWFGTSPEMVVTSCLEATSDDFSWLEEWCIDVRDKRPDYLISKCVMCVPVTDIKQLNMFACFTGICFVSRYCTR